MPRRINITPETVYREVALWLEHLATAHRIRRSTRGPRMAVRVTGGMGDQLIAARFIRDLLVELGPIPVDVFSSDKGMDWIFGAPGIGAQVYVGGPRLLRAVKRSYICVLHVTHTVDLIHLDRTGRVPADLRARLSRLSGRLISYRPLVAHTVKLHPKLDFQIGRLATLMERDRRTFLHEMADIPYGGDALDLPADRRIVRRLDLLDRPFITVQAAHKPGRPIGRRAHTRYYPHFDALMRLVKAAFPDLLIVQVGVGATTPLPSADMSLVNATTIEETAALLEASVMHFDSEGGIVHLAACLGAQSCVLFGPTPVRYFSYPENINIAPKVCGDCWGLTGNWMRVCLRGFHDPICMFEQDPAGVAARVLPVLRERLARLERLEGAPAPQADAGRQTV